MRYRHIWLSMLWSSSGSFLGVVAVALSTVPYSISVLAHSTEVHALLQSMLWSSLMIWQVLYCTFQTLTMSSDIHAPSWPTNSNGTLGWNARTVCSTNSNINHSLFRDCVTTLLNCQWPWQKSTVAAWRSLCNMYYAYWSDNSSQTISACRREGTVW